MNNRFGNRNMAPTRNRLRLGTRVGLAVLLAAFIGYMLFFLQLPYYVYMPGSAEELRPMVSVQQGKKAEAGTFMLTTVGVSNANVASYIAAQFSKNYELIDKAAVRQPNETEKEYSERQTYNMMSSQSSAIQAAYNKLGIAFKMATEAIVVMHVNEGVPAASVLRAGDIIKAVDGATVGTGDELRAKLQSKKPNDTVAIDFERGTEKRSDTITLAELPAEGDQPARAGLGISLAEYISVKPDDASKQVEIKAGEIGGPSAGLMFSLEIYNQLSSDDLTKGYRVAGTGTIDAAGHVGDIGGIQHKIVAADREKAELFFAPKGNAPDAQKRAEEIHTKMKIVPVGTMEDALAYLKALPTKAS